MLKLAGDMVAGGVYMHIKSKKLYRPARLPSFGLKAKVEACDSAGHSLERVMWVNASNLTLIRIQAL